MTSTAVRQACHAVLPAAGIGTRMGGDVPKQYLPLAGRTLLEHSLAALLAVPDIDTVVVALHPEDSLGRDLAILQDARVLLVTGGAERSDSVLAGLDVLARQADAADWVLVHDAARPCLRPGDVAQLLQRCRETGEGGILAQPVVDTVKQAESDGRVSQTLDRSRLWRAQTPQMFPLGQLRTALMAAAEQGLPVTDEASAMELAGQPVHLVPCGPHNLKVTVPDDLPLAAWYLQQAREQA